MQATRSGPVVVAWAALDPDGPDSPDVAELDPPDLARAAGLPGRRRREFLLGRALITGLIRDSLPGCAGWSIGSRACPRCGERHGGVELTGVPAVGSVAYTEGLVVAALAPSTLVGRLGVDVEVDAPDDIRDRDLARLLGPSREPVLQRWTRIEAVLKADGRGLLADPTDVRFSRRTATVAGGRTRYRVVGVSGPAGFVISLAWCAAGSVATGSGRAIH
jgi:4'-phosphopantetheinyl transferase